MEKTTPLIFGKRNYLFMLIGIVVIAFGFILMMGNGANTTSEGNFDPNYFNEEIFSFRRIRLAPIIILIGFVIEIFAILMNPNTTEKN
ncbi:MAG: DUF3098 domain-containing protein [Flavobacteriales bacterium]